MDTKELKLRMRENVRQCRKDLGYTQEVLAEKCGFTAPFCAQVETGVRLPSPSNFITLAEALDATPTVLIYGKSKSERVEHIVNLLSGMSENDIAYVEKMILLTRDWLNEK